MVLVDRRARLFRAASLAVILMWVDIRMLVGCWALWAQSPDHSSPTWREDHERLFVQALDSLMYYARRWVNLEVRLADRMHFGSDAEPLTRAGAARRAGRLARHRVAALAHRGSAAAHRAGRGAALGPGDRHDPHPAPVLLRPVGVPAAGRTASAGLTRMAESMDDGDVFVIFPEGQNWTPGRRAGYIRRLRERGELARARRAEELRNVLPPKTRGAWAARVGPPRRRRHGARARRPRAALDAPDDLGGTAVHRPAASSSRRGRMPRPTSRSRPRRSPAGSTSGGASSTRGWRTNAAPYLPGPRAGTPRRGATR